ncbi:MAG: hypothetical protein IKV94_03720 [Clostridia bacterium]|nr:hypothetical protein [Clostridia bacterium]
MKNKKRGATAISISVITIICMVFLTLMVAFIIECIKPLMLQQKLQSVATKYMYVIERFGYLTKQEKEQLIDELSAKGFETQKIRIEYPEYKRRYGDLIELKILYNYKSKTIPFYGMEEYDLVVTKISFCKN